MIGHSNFARLVVLAAEVAVVTRGSCRVPLVYALVVLSHSTGTRYGVAGGVGTKRLWVLGGADGLAAKAGRGLNPGGGLITDAGCGWTGKCDGGSGPGLGCIAFIEKGG